MSSVARIPREETISVPKTVVARIGVSGRAILRGKTLSISEARKEIADAARAHGKKHSRV
jgi:hypothetical protein